MDKKIAGLLGMVAGLATLTSAQAATGPAPNSSQALQASTYADLLAPISNAAALLKADEAARAQQQPEPADDFQVAQLYYVADVNHHHHHYHHHAAFFGIPGVGGVVVGRR
jgi:predicted RNase H-like HicB family nuclease